MSIFTYHLANASMFTSIRAMLFPLSSKDVVGLVHAEFMTAMSLGSPIFSPSRMLLKQLVVFAQWENEEVLDKFLAEHEIGKLLSTGWHVRLTFIRRWGTLSEFEFSQDAAELIGDEDPVVAVTIARMKMRQIPRFIKWGRPVEKLVRDHHGTTLSLASIRMPRTISTFSIWERQKDMRSMVLGHSTVPEPKRHIDAMKERDRKYSL